MGVNPFNLWNSSTFQAISDELPLVALLSVVSINEDEMVITCSTGQIVPTPPIVSFLELARWFLLLGSMRAMANLARSCENGWN
jgi:hypothetical protein